MSEESQFEQVVRTAKIRRYKPFEGQIRAKMPELQKEGRELISSKKLEELRLHGKEGDKQYLRNSYVNVAVAVVPNPSGDEIKFVHAHPIIYTLKADTALERGAFPPAQEHYDGHDGFVLSGSEVSEFRNDNYALPSRRRAFWEFLAEGDAKLAKDYEQDVCQTLDLTFDEVMGLWLPNTKGLRLLGVGAVVPTSGLLPMAATFLATTAAGVWSGS